MSDTVFPYDDEVVDPYDDEVKNPHEVTEGEEDESDDNGEAPPKRGPGRPRKNST